MNYSEYLHNDSEGYPQDKFDNFSRISGKNGIIHISTAIITNTTNLYLIIYFFSSERAAGNITITAKGVIHMKIICSKSNLLNGVNTVSKAVPSKTTMSILECILIDASKGEIKLTANDMELGIETIIEGEIIEKGIIALDAKIFLEMVRKLPDNDVTIATDPSYKATVTCEKAKFNIVGKSGEDFSYLPQIDRSESICVSQFTLKEVIRQTIFSIADNFTN